MPRDDGSTADLFAEGISLGYSGRQVVAGLNLTIPSAALTVLVGPNGSGKSTLLKALAGLMSPSAGRIVLDGQAIARRSPKEVAKRIGVLSQGPVAPDGLTVRALIQQGRYPHRTLFSRWSAADDAACAEALQLTAMDGMADRPLDSLSGGQRQRAWIALTLAQGTDILLLDEPTTYLDLAHQIEILDLVTDLVAERKKTVVAVLHDINQAARYADHIVLLKDGAIYAEGRPGDIVSAASIRNVFGVEAMVIADPATGLPLCVPVPKGRGRTPTSSP